MWSKDKATMEVLRNRFQVMRARTKGTHPIPWRSFEEWLLDFEAVVPKDFSTETHRISYTEYTKDGMKVERTSKRKARHPLPDDKRVLLAAELTRLLLDPKIDVTLSELVAEAEKMVT